MEKDLKLEIKDLKTEVEKIKGVLIKMSKSYKKLELLNILRDLSIEGNKFLRLTSGRFKRRYQKLIESDIWKEAKKHIIQLKLLESDNIVCSSCNKPIKDPRKSVLHHTYYNQFYLFEPKNTTLVHYHCHQNLHTNIEDQEKNSELYM